MFLHAEFMRLDPFDEDKAMTQAHGVRSLISTALLLVAGLLALGATCLLLGYLRSWMLMRNIPPAVLPYMMVRTAMSDPLNPTKDACATAALAGAMTLLGGLFVALAIALRR